MMQPGDPLALAGPRDCKRPSPQAARKDPARKTEGPAPARGFRVAAAGGDSRDSRKSQRGGSTARAGVVSVSSVLSEGEGCRPGGAGGHQTAGVSAREGWIFGWMPRKRPCLFGSENRRLTEKNGAGEGTRTPDPIITNDVLYQLSYTGILLCLAPDAKPPLRDARPWDASFLRGATGAITVRSAPTRRDPTRARGATMGGPPAQAPLRYRAGLSHLP